jgi:hypothetical protein
MKENKIDIATYNRTIRKLLKESDTNQSIEISPREKFWDDNKKENVVYDSIKKKPVVKLSKDTKKDDTESYLDYELYQYNKSQDNSLQAGLISNRHEMIDAMGNPFIYSGPIKAEWVHNYDKLYQIALDFLDTRVIADGYDRLKVNVTGLTQCTACLIKACYEREIDLTLLHYDNVTHRYNEQVIIGEDSSSNTSLLDIFINSKKYYDFRLVNHDVTYFKGLKMIYVIKVENMTDVASNLNNNSNTICYVTDDIDIMFKIYANEVKRVNEIKSTCYRVVADEITFGTTNIEYKFSNNYGSFYNTPKK